MMIIYVIYAVALLIGLWALICLVSALIKSRGPAGLIRGWLQAVRGK